MKEIMKSSDLRGTLEVLDVKISKDSLRRVRPWSFDQVSKEIKIKYGREVDPIERIDLPAWITIEPMTVRITLAFNKEYNIVLVFEILPGYITDLASIPSIFRSWISKSSSEITIGALIHDILFGCHYFEFSDCNVIFREIIGFYGMGFFKRWAIYGAVSSPVGLIIYNGLKKDERRKNTSFVRITEEVERCRN